MFQLIFILFNLGVVASALLGVATALRRVVIRLGTHRCVRARQPEIEETLLSSRDAHGVDTSVEIRDHVIPFYAHDRELVDAVSG